MRVFTLPLTNPQLLTGGLYNTSVPARRSVIRITLALTLCVALLAGSKRCTLVINSASAHGQSGNSNREGRPRPGKPEGGLPDLEDAQNESRQNVSRRRRFHPRYVRRKCHWSRGTGAAWAIRHTRRVGSGRNRIRRAHASRSELRHRRFSTISSSQTSSPWGGASPTGPNDVLERSIARGLREGTDLAEIGGRRVGKDTV